MASKIKVILAVTAFAAGICAYAQTNSNDPFNSGRSSMGARGSDFNSSRAGNFNDYRTKLNAEYERIVRKPWGEFNKQRGQEDPEQREKPVPPVVIDDDKAKGEREDRQIDIDEVVRPRRDNNGAQPIAPVRDNPDAK
ncbi:MAG: hypothetical protein K2M76_02890, partial [Muribaculaceae bacterium]|nr:hypothetical protein [Muribaculaceae bacterium]